MENKNVHSYHAFLFPFRWERKGNNYNNYLDAFWSALIKADWNYNPFLIKTEKDYNEFVYFYEYARDAIYNTDKEFKPNQTTYHFNYKITAVRLRVKKN